MNLWMQTFTGQILDLESPTPEMIDIRDIAHSLSLVCRFGGHCKHFYSVAEHSLLVEKLGHNSQSPCSPKLAMALLLHDSAEAYIGDIITPIKTLIGYEIQDLEHKWLRAIQTKFNLGTALTSPDREVKKADLEALAIEATLHLNQPDWRWMTVCNKPSQEQLQRARKIPLAPAVAEDLFLRRFGILTQEPPTPEQDDIPT